MAQACVMSRPRQEQQLFTPAKQSVPPQLDTSLITSTVRKRKVLPPESPPPAQPALQPLAEEGKRQRTPSIDRGLNDLDVVVRLQLASPAAELKHAAATPIAAADDMEEEEAGEAARVAGAAEQRRQQLGAWQQPLQHLQQQQQHDGRRAPSLGPHAVARPEEEEEEEVLFSPAFHLCREGSREDLAAGCSGGGELAGMLLPPAGGAVAGAAAQQQRQQQSGGGQSDTENTSTDQSTGTSACLAEEEEDDADISDADEATAGAGEGRKEEQEGAEEEEEELRSCSLASVATQAPQPPAYVDADDDCGSAGAGASCPPDDYIEFDPLLFIKRLPPLERCVPPRRDFLLPKKTRRSKQKTLVLDLDETLVHSTLDGYCRPDFTFPVEVGSMTHMVSVRQRPHLHTFLERVAQLFEVVVFTASQRVYAEQLLNIVDPERRLVRHRVYRESCVFWEGNYLKDLTVLGRDLAHTIIVDNSPQAFGFQIDNGIPIESWYDDDRDEELLKLIPFLEKVAHVEDVRPHIQKRYRLRRLVEAAADPEQCLLLQQEQQFPQQQQQQQQQAAGQPPAGQHA